MNSITGCSEMIKVTRKELTNCAIALVAAKHRKMTLTATPKTHWMVKMLKSDPGRAAQTFKDMK